eukprot:TRINITY_DN500_c0_g1_i1.p1 TRINITY_DN500_c0_g1~~TRINITY_DN500_c0_g1_i1.p1  ORF type:complete len:372 (-),score=73.57 TRINITY_DN500_c0_g1_i1:98-1213(-)
MEVACFKRIDAFKKIYIDQQNFFLWSLASQFGVTNPEVILKSSKVASALLEKRERIAFKVISVNVDSPSVTFLSKPSNLEGIVNKWLNDNTAFRKTSLELVKCLTDLFYQSLAPSSAPPSPSLSPRVCTEDYYMRPLTPRIESSLIKKMKKSVPTSRWRLFHSLSRCCRTLKDRSKESNPLVRFIQRASSITLTPPLSPSPLSPSVILSSSSSSSSSSSAYSIQASSSSASVSFVSSLPQLSSTSASVLSSSSTISTSIFNPRPMVTLSSSASSLSSSIPWRKRSNSFNSSNPRSTIARWQSTRQLKINPTRATARASSATSTPTPISTHTNETLCVPTVSQNSLSSTSFRSVPSAIIPHSHTIRASSYSS